MDKSNHDHIKGICCDVSNCHYHHENRQCSASEIKVGPTYASTSTDTVCATFKPNSNKKSV